MNSVLSTTKKKKNKRSSDDDDDNDNIERKERTKTEKRVKITTAIASTASKASKASKASTIATTVDVGSEESADVLSRVIADLQRKDVIFYKSAEFVQAATQHLTARHIIEFLQQSQSSLSTKESIKLAELALTRLVAVDHTNMDTEKLTSLLSKLLSRPNHDTNRVTSNDTNHLSPPSTTSPTVTTTMSSTVVKSKTSTSSSATATAAAASSVSVIAGSEGWTKNDAVRRKDDTRKSSPTIGQFIKMSTSHPDKAIVKWKMIEKGEAYMKKELVPIQQLVKIGTWSPLTI